ncbi:MAG: flagellin/flagellar hook associated protein [Cyanobacteria bacterium RYN_339]|nr:flagellin/flagellar hook associated protein [Cyanobacteria bacterium RYN_339]
MLSLNVSSFFSQRLSAQSDKTDSIMERLSTGLRINRSSDDAAGATIAETMRSQVEGAQQAGRNIQDALNIVKIGEDGVTGLMPIIDRMKELAVKAANSTNTQADKDAIQNEADELRGLFAQAYFTAKDFRIALDGKDNADRVLNFQVGPNAGDLVQVDYNPLRNILGPMVINMYGYDDLYNSPYQELLAGYMPQPIPKPNDPVPPPPLGPVTPPGTTWAQYFPKQVSMNGTSTDTDNTMKFLDQNKTALLGQVTYLGAIANRLEHTADRLSSFEIDITDSLSKIRDVDMAHEVTQLSKSQVIQQSAQAMLSQANARPQQVIDLLRSSR